MHNQKEEDHDPNVAMTCSCCSTAHKADWHFNNPDTAIEPDGYCKIAFVEGDLTEHMWVKIDKITSEDDCSLRYYGKLWNDPALLFSIRNGDDVTFLRPMIEDYLPPTKTPS